MISSPNNSSSSSDASSDVSSEPNASVRPRVLFIGATGAVGHQVVPTLCGSFEVTACALGGGTVGDLAVVDADITDMEAVERVVSAGDAAGRRFDAIVNCAIANYAALDRKDPDSLREYYERCIDINARGAYHVYEAARRARVPRVVFVSSLTAVFGQPGYKVIDENALDRPRDVYAACKVFGEQVGRSYAFPQGEAFALRVSCLRLAMPYPVFTGSDRSWQKSRGRRGCMVHMDDVARAIECALTIDEPFGIYSIVSNSDNAFIAPELYAGLGYKPGWKFTQDTLSRVE